MKQENQIHYIIVVSCIGTFCTLVMKGRRMRCLQLIPTLIHISQQRWMEIDRGSQKSWSIIFWWTKDITTWCGDHSPTLHFIIYKYLYEHWDLNLSQHHQTCCGGTMCCKARFGRKKKNGHASTPHYYLWRSHLFTTHPMFVKRKPNINMWWRC